MSRFFGILAFLFTFAFATHAKAGLIVDPTFDALHIADAAEFDSVGVLIGHRVDGANVFLGSMFMFDHYNGLASAHGAATTPQDFLSYTIRIGSNFREEGSYKSYNVSSMMIDPTYERLGHGHDSAILRFEEGIFGINPIPLYEGANTAGDTYRIVGGGRFGLAGSDDSILDGNFRGGYNNLESLSLDEDYLRFRFDRPGSANYVDLEMLAWSGDSGAPVMKEVFTFDDEGNIISSEWHAAAQIALGGLPHYGASFDASIINFEFVNDSKFVPQSTAVPEPGSMLLLGTGALVAGFLRRRRLLSENTTYSQK